MTTLRVALIAGGLYDDLYSTFGRFTAKTGIEIGVAAHLPQHELNTLLVREARSPVLNLDLVTTHTKYSPSQRALLQPLDDLLEDEELDAFLPEPLSACRIAGNLCQLPRNCDVRLYTYRTDLVQPPATWEQTLSDSQNLRENGLTGSAFGFTGKMSGLVGTFYEILTSAGGEFLDDFDQPRFVSDQGVWALTLLRDLYQTAVPEMSAWSYDEIAGAFSSGTLAAYTEWPGYWGTITSRETSAVHDRVGIALYPEGPSGRRCVYGGCHTFALTRTSVHQPEALALLRFLTEDTVLMSEAQMGSLVPKPSVLDHQAEALSDSSLEGQRLALLRETMDHALLWPPRTARWPEIEDALWPVLQRGFVGIVPVDVALEQAAETISRLLAGRASTAEAS